MIAEQFDVFFFDLDGVVYLDPDPLPDAVESLARLRDQGAEIRFLTNDPTRTRTARRDQLNEMGVEATKDEIVTSSWATARYLSNRGIESVYAIGSAGLVAELESEGHRIDPDDPDAVVVGSDDATTYEDIKQASLLIQNGAAFVATNDDATYPRPEGRVPGTGAIVSAVARTVDTRPTIAGKPDATMFDIAAASLDTHEPDVLMLGDTPSADIVGAHRAGYSAALIADEPPVYPSTNDFRRPDATMATLAGLFDPEKRIDHWKRPDFPWPDEVRTAVAAVVRNDEGVFLERQSAEEAWQLPLVTIEPGESIVEAARRALSGHGVGVEVTEPLGVYSDPRKVVVDGDGGARTQLITTCARCIPDDPPSVDGELTTLANPSTRRLDPTHERWVRDALADDGPVLD